MLYNEKTRYQDDREHTMDGLTRYIDICLIDEYATKSFTNGYSLDVNDLSDNEKENFLAELMKYDTAVRDLIHYHMQQLINKRLPECEANDRAHAGLRLVNLSNGDTRLERGVAW